MEKGRYYPQIQRLHVAPDCDPRQRPPVWLTLATTWIAGPFEYRSRTTNPMRFAIDVDTLTITYTEGFTDVEPYTLTIRHFWTDPQPGSTIDMTLAGELGAARWTSAIDYRSFSPWYAGGSRPWAFQDYTYSGFDYQLSVLGVLTCKPYN